MAPATQPSIAPAAGRQAIAQSLADQFCSVRQQTEKLCAPLSAEDMMVQSCPEASPVKWHLAHTTWFFETFLLRDFLPGYRQFHPDFLWLFNSYYKSLSAHPEKKLRASFSRPPLAAILDYRRHVESAMRQLFDHGLTEEAQDRLLIGLNHEQQHQELIVTDIKHALWTNPLHPAYLEAAAPAVDEPAPMAWVAHPGGLLEIGAGSPGFAFDNECPRHREFLTPFQFATRTVTCFEYLEFMRDGGYARPELWLSEGWDTVQALGWKAPLYWYGHDDAWTIYTLGGNLPFAKLASSPVCHLSFFEAEAYARWAGKRLPTEAEWEAMAAGAPVDGNLLEAGRLHPSGEVSQQTSRPAQLFGNVWEWTASPYIGYPGFRALPGTLGEYNGKFMCNQMVLRGGSVATPATHIRASYRNFFAPATRWQFSGIRLAGEPE